MPSGGGMGWSWGACSLLKKRIKRLARVANPLRRVRRRYVPWNSSLPELFSELNELRCRYVVLRWFETLPSVEKGEDVDLLVDNEHLLVLRGRLSYGFTERLLRRKLKLDIHSVYPPAKRVAYYPPHLASKILENSVIHPSGARVPCPEDHFFSLAFHALYHKGLSSGIPMTASDAGPSAAQNKYVRTLSALAAELGYDIAITLVDLDRFLGEHDWRPSLDYIEKASPRDAWRSKLIDQEHSELPHVPGLAVFLLREEALARPDSVDFANSVLEREGFNILAAKVIEPEIRASIASELRGGDWGTGPNKKSGGGPAAIIVALDVFPRKPTGRLQRKQPDLENILIASCKSQIRAWWNGGLSESERCNIVHSSDHSRQAIAYIRVAAPELESEVRSKAEDLLAQVRLPGEVVQQFRQKGRRSIVELVRQEDGQIVVRKIFRPGREEYFAREVDAIRSLGQINPDIVPEILEIGPNYFTMPYYKQRWTQRLKFPIPVPAMKKLFVGASQFFERGYLMFDFRPQNIIVSGRNDVKIIDYEKFYDRSGHELLKKYSFSDFLNGKISRIPFAENPLAVDGRKYYQAWGRSTAVPLSSVLNDPLYLVYLKRWTYGYYVFGKSLLMKTSKWNR
jgi:hypothetical protein